MKRVVLQILQSLSAKFYNLNQDGEMLFLLLVTSLVRGFFNYTVHDKEKENRWSKLCSL